MLGPPGSPIFDNELKRIKTNYTNYGNNIEYPDE